MRYVLLTAIVLTAFGCSQKEMDSFNARINKIRCVDHDPRGGKGRPVVICDSLDRIIEGNKR